jgi:hypothetical protein
MGIGALGWMACLFCKTKSPTHHKGYTMKMIIFAMAALFALALTPVVQLFATVTGFGHEAASKTELYGKAFAEIARAHLWNYTTGTGLVLGANTLTSLIPTIYEALDVVSREMIGFIPGVMRNSSAERAALNQTILVPIAPTATTADNTPGVSAPNTGDQTVGNVSMTISKSKHAPIRWNGEEQKGLINAGSYAGILRGQFENAFRALVNEIESDLWLTAYKNASRAYGTAAAAPFGTAGDLSDFAGVMRILEDNGAPKGDLQLALGGAAMQNLRGKQSVLFKVNEAGSSDMLRNGMTDRVQGFALRNSAAVAPVTKGTGAAYVTSGSTAVGVKDIALVTGTGTVLAGDVVTFAADANNKYVVGTGIAAPGTITLNDPGARAVIATANAMTIGNSYTPNVAFARSAIQLVTRAPQMPVGPNGESLDMADDVITVTDPVSGLAFDIAVYRQFMQLVYHVRLAWGTQAVKDEHIAILMG